MGSLSESRGIPSECRAGGRPALMIRRSWAGPSGLCMPRRAGALKHGLAVRRPEGRTCEKWVGGTGTATHNAKGQRWHTLACSPAPESSMEQHNLEGLQVFAPSGPTTATVKTDVERRPEGDGVMNAKRHSDGLEWPVLRDSTTRHDSPDAGSLILQPLRRSPGRSNRTRGPSHMRARNGSTP
jgi:hypothetical protein